MLCAGGKRLTCYREIQRDRDIGWTIEEGTVADKNIQLAKQKIGHRVWKRVRYKREIESEELRASISGWPERAWEDKNGLKRVDLWSGSRPGWGDQTKSNISKVREKVRLKGWWRAPTKRPSLTWKAPTERGQPGQRGSKWMEAQRGPSLLGPANPKPATGKVPRRPDQVGWRQPSQRLKTQRRPGPIGRGQYSHQMLIPSKITLWELKIILKTMIVILPNIILIPPLSSVVLTFLHSFPLK